MKKLIIFLLCAIVGGGAGFAGAIFTAPPEPDSKQGEAAPPPKPDADPLESSYVKLRNQFIVPIVRDDTVRSMVIMTLAAQSDTYGQEEISLLEPKLQAALLSALFDYSSMGGFTGNFTVPTWREALQNLLRTTAQEEVSPDIDDILLLTINRQDY